jgi:hypothetical protein
MKRLIISVVLALALLLIPASAVLAATFDTVTVTAVPSYIAITNAPNTWVINDVVAAGGKTILINTTYYSNPLGDTTSPTVGGATDAECRFTITNTSTVATKYTVIFADPAAGDSTNGNTGAAGAATFGAKTYFSGQATAAWVVAKNADSATAYPSLAATTPIKWGLIYASQTGAWASGISMVSTITITAAAV